MTRNYTKTLHCLGPTGTFSERAALELARKLGDPPIVLHPNLSVLVEAVCASGASGVVPYYNLLEGLVQEGLDLIFERHLRVVGAYRLPIVFVAASRDGKMHQSAVASHPKALAQCSEFLRKHLSDLPQNAVSSTAEAARQAKDNPILAIASEFAAVANELQIVQRDVGNRPGGRINFTDFLLVTASGGEPFPAACKESTRTLISLTPRCEHPGLLAGILQQFAFYGLNIAKIHSRPTLVPVNTEIEPQMFYLEIMAPSQMPSLQQCVQTLDQRYSDENAHAIHILGSWRELLPPRPQRPSSPLDLLDPMTIIGVNGGFGRLLATTLIDLGLGVHGIDLQPEPVVENLASYHRTDVQNLTAAQIASMKWVVLCTPEPATLAAIPMLAGLGPDAFVTDILSVKTPLAEALAKSTFEGAWLSLHPMFAPSLSIRGRNVCVVPMHGVANDPRAQAVDTLLCQLGAHQTRLTPGDHDRITSLLQAATHAALFSLGKMLASYGIDTDVTLRLATPVNQALMSMLARMTSASDELYQSMQVDNPFAAESRQALIEAMRSLDDRMRVAEAGTMRQVFDECRAALGAHADDLVHTAAAIARTIADCRTSGAPPKFP